MALSPKKNYLAPWLILSLVLLVIGSFTAHSLYREHERIDRQERERLSTQAKVIGENMAHQLDGVYRALEGIRKDLHLWRGENGMALANRQLVALSDAMPGIRTFFITDAAGKIIAANREQVIGQDISYRKYFQAPLMGRNPTTLYVSPPFKTILGNFVINVALMIPGPKGEFSGIVSAALDPEYFITLLGSVLYAPDMWAALAHGDGEQFLMVPDRPGMSGLNLAKPGSFFTRHIESGRSSNVMTGMVLATGEERMMAVRTIRPGNVPIDKPLVTAVGRNLSALHADCLGEVFAKGALFGMLVLSMTMALFFYQRRQRKFEEISAGVVEELLQAKETALRANEAKSRFLSTVAHEFRTPLALLTSSSDILDRYGEHLSSEEKLQQRDHIHNAVRQMSSLVNSVLAFNHQDAHPLLNDPVAVNVGQFCRNLAGEIQTVWGSGQELTVSIADNCGTVQVDEPLFRRVLENLLTNAFRYTPPEGKIFLNVSQEDGLLQLTVADSGIGIPEEERKKIFEAFYRCRNVGGRRGLGLGLSIVREALLQLDGTIEVESVVGDGTTMLLKIPTSALEPVKEQ